VKSGSILALREILKLAAISALNSLAYILAIQCHLLIMSSFLKFFRSELASNRCIGPNLLILSLSLFGVDHAPNCVLFPIRIALLLRSEDYELIRWIENPLVPNKPVRRYMIFNPDSLISIDHLVLKSVRRYLPCLVSSAVC